MMTYRRRHDALSSTSDSSIDLSGSEVQRHSHELKRASDTSAVQVNAVIAASDSSNDVLRETESSVRHVAGIVCEVAAVSAQHSAGIASSGPTRAPLVEQTLQWQRAEAMFRWSAQQLAAGVGEPGHASLEVVS